MIMTHPHPGAFVLLAGFGPGCIVPDGWHVVSAVNQDGSFHVGGNTAIWPRRIIEIKAKTPRVGATRDE